MNQRMKEERTMATRILTTCFLLLAFSLAASAQVQITPFSYPDAFVGEAYTGPTPQATGGVTPYIWSIATGTPLPPGFTINSQTGVISGTPTQSGDFLLTLRVTDSSGSGVGATYETGIRILQRPVVLPATIPAVTAGTPYSQEFYVEGGIPPFWITIPEVTIPGMTFDFTEGYNGATLLLSGTPTVPGTYNFTVSSSDEGGLTASRNYSLVVNPLYTITTTTLPGANLGVGYSAGLQVNTGLTVAYTLTAGALPPGVILGSNGVLSGIPTATGTFNFTVVANTVNNNPTFFVPSIFSPPRALSISVTRLPVTITTATLPDGTAATPYSQTLASTGGVPGYTYSISGGSLPTGITLSPGGIISGVTLIPGAYTFTVQVTDSVGTTGQRTYTVNFVAPYVISTTSLPGGTAGVNYAAVLQLSPPAAASWSLASGSLPPGLSLNAGTGVIAGLPTTAGTFNFSVRATVNAQYGDFLTPTRALSIVIAPNPVILQTATLPGGVAGTPYAQTLTSTGGAPAYTYSVVTGSLPAGLTLNGAAGTITGTPTTPGTFSFEIEVRDQINGTARRTFSMVIQPALTVTSSLLPDATLNAPYSALLQFTGTTSTVTWQIVSGTLPPGLALNPATGVVSGTATELGSYSFIARVGLAGTNFFSEPAQIRLRVIPPPLSITPSALPGGVVGVPYSATLTGSGGVGGYVFSLIAGTLPAGLTFDPASRTISGTPTAHGSFPLTIRLTSGSDVLEQQFTLRIQPAPLNLQTTSLRDGYRGESYLETLSASGGVAPYRFTVSAGTLPPSVSLSQSGTISGQPSGAGVFQLTITVEDSLRTTTSRAFTLSVFDVLTLTGPSPLPAATEGEAYSAALQATGGKPPYVFSLAGGTLPAGLALAASGEVSGTPTVPGPFVFDALVTDANGRTSQRSIQVAVIGVLTLAPTSLPAGTLLREYAPALSVSGGIGPYAWSLNGDLPPGVFFESGQFRGAPTSTGTFAFSVTVTDSRGRTLTRAYSIVVSGGVTITTSSLPQGRAGEAYRAQLAAQGGRPPYRWSIDGTLPGGVDLDPGLGLIAGIPAGGGTFNLRLRVEDQDGLSATRELTLTVVLPAAPTLRITNLPTTAAPGQQPTFGVVLDQSYPIPLSGDVDLTFAPDRGPDDPAVQFANGSRRLPFTVPSGQTQANFAASPAALQTGTVAGVITLTSTYRANGQNVTPSPAPTQTLRISPAAPVLTRLDLARTSNGFELAVFGFSTPRDVVRATVRLTPAQGATLTTSEFTIDVNSLFTTWFGSSQSVPFGSQFRLSLPFNLSGSAADITSVSVSLTNSVGTSNTLTANF